MRVARKARAFFCVRTGKNFSGMVEVGMIDSTALGGARFYATHTTRGREFPSPKSHEVVLAAGLLERNGAR
jgi:hypothetical protein